MTNTKPFAVRPSSAPVYRCSWTRSILPRDCRSSQPTLPECRSLAAEVRGDRLAALKRLGLSAGSVASPT